MNLKIANNHFNNLMTFMAMDKIKADDKKNNI